MSTSTCPNCDAPRTGRWCAACGQEHIGPERRSLRWLLGQFAEALTDIDSRFLRSLRSLLFRPGEMGADWLADRRARWMSPIALFVIVNVSYFFAPQLTDLNLPLGDQFSQVHGSHARALVDGRLAERGITLEEYANSYALESSNLAKTLIILHVPPYTLLVMLLLWRRRIPFADHFAVALHTWTAYLLVMLAVPIILRLGMVSLDALGVEVQRSAARLALQASLFALVSFYIHGALHRAYGLGWWTACALTPVLFAGGALSHFVYRSAQFYLTFALT